MSGILLVHDELENVYTNKVPDTFTPAHILVARAFVWHQTFSLKFNTIKEQHCGQESHGEWCQWIAQIKNADYVSTSV